MTATIDALAELEQRAHNRRAEDEAAEACSIALTKLLRGKINDSGQRNMASCAFFATLAMKLRRKPDWSIGTACVDGKLLSYNPDFWLGLSIDERIAVLAHEVLHCSNQHHTRRGERDPRGWNVACDLAINDLLKECGFTLPADGLFPEQHGLPKGLSSEEYYNLLPKVQGLIEGDDPGGCGGIADAGQDKSTLRQQEAEWKVATAQAAQMAKEKGNLPGGLERFVEAVTAPQVDWRAELREFVNTFAKNDYAWTPPNRRYVHMGLYLPSLHSEELGDVAVAVDASGSCWDPKTLAMFAAEIEGIGSVAQCSVTVIYHDTVVKHVQHWSPSDGPLRLEAKGGGGTDHRPVFEWIAENMAPVCLVALTDLYSMFPDCPPDYPVLWVTENEQSAPWGRTLRIS